MGFTHFQGCFAIRCGSGRCGTHFCGWCMTDCGTSEEAHAHVLQCRRNRSQNVGAMRYYSNSLDFWNARRDDWIPALTVLFSNDGISNQVERRLLTFLIDITGDTPTEQLAVQLVDPTFDHEPFILGFREAAAASAAEAPPTEGGLLVLKDWLLGRLAKAGGELRELEDGDDSGAATKGG